MKRQPIPAAALMAFRLVSGTPAAGHPGSLDGNGCHCEAATGVITATGRETQSRRERAGQEITRERLPRQVAA
jgi:hypothetical protein